MLTSSSNHRCNWMKCPESFTTRSLLHAHLSATHFEPETFAAQCRVPGGRWDEWRMVHDVNYTMATDSWLATVPPNRFSSDSIIPELSQNDSFDQSLVSPKITPRSSLSPSHELEGPHSHLVTPDLGDKTMASNTSFTSFSLLDTPVPASQNPRGADVSPTLSMLVRRSHGSSLPPSPHSRSPSPSSTSDKGPPNKKRRISVGGSPTDAVEAEKEEEIEGHSDLPLATDSDEDDYNPETDDSFPEFPPSDDNPIGILSGGFQNKDAHQGRSVSPEGSGNLVESQLSQQPLSQGELGSKPLQDKCIHKTLDERLVPLQRGPRTTLDDSLTEPETQSQDAKNSAGAALPVQQHVESVTITLVKLISGEARTEKLEDTPDSPPRGDCQLGISADTPVTPPPPRRLRSASRSNAVEPGGGNSQELPKPGSLPQSRRSSRLRSTTPGPIEVAQANGKVASKTYSRSRSVSRPPMSANGKINEQAKQARCAEIGRIDELDENDNASDHNVADSRCDIEGEGIHDNGTEGQPTGVLLSPKMSVPQRNTRAHMELRGGSVTRQSQGKTAVPAAKGGPAAIKAQGMDESSQLQLITQAPYKYSSQDFDN